MDKAKQIKEIERSDGTTLGRAGRETALVGGYFSVEQNEVRHEVLAFVMMDEMLCC